MHRQTALERAYEMARSGECSIVTDLKRALHREGDDHQQVEGRALRADLNRQCRQAREA
jgi:hypothetical protein